MIQRHVLCAALVLAAASPAYADGVLGEWTREDGTSKVRFANCGAAICGAISWVKDPNAPGKVGQRVFFDMIPAGENTWRGTAFNPDDGKQYTGKMTLHGASLVTAGCVFGGLICKSVTWTH